MPNVYLDAILFACPAQTADHPDFGEYLGQLIDVDDLRRTECLALRISVKTAEVLATANCYPFWDRLPGVAFPQRGDVLRIIDAFLNKGTKVEDSLRISDLLLDQPTCNPAGHLTGRSVRLVEHHHNLLAFMCIEKEIREGDHCDPVLLTRGLANPNAMLHTKGTVMIVEWLEGAVRIDVPYNYQDAFVAFPTSDALLAAIDPVDIWVCEKDLENAIRIQTARASGQPQKAYLLSDSGRFELGREFLQSVQESGIGQTPARSRALLRACSETILNLNPGATHALRHGPEPTQRPRLRAKDGARAMRRDIDYEFHLHYWVTDAGPEFSRVVTHNDFAIAE